MRRDNTKKLCNFIFDVVPFIKKIVRYINVKQQEHIKSQKIKSYTGNNTDTPITPLLLIKIMMMIPLLLLLLLLLLLPPPTKVIIIVVFIIII